jgi:hypothetical protein
VPPCGDVRDLNNQCAEQKDADEKPIVSSSFWPVSAFTPTRRIPNISMHHPLELETENQQPLSSGS